MSGIGRNGKEVGGVKEIVKKNLLKLGGRAQEKRKKF